ncbi:hypothetical protein [Pseudidiomarina donghaiensis]|uniref:hypothetical protein n=1 Tax=Pseudidiomarina donghaiensis TaxID=519452 RepID=UPI003A980827
MALLKWFGALLLLALAATGTAQASMLKPMQKPIQEPMQAGANELAQWPQWVFAPTSDYPDTHLYGLGFGASKSAARQHALAEVVLQISTDVQVLQRSVMARAKSNDAVTVRDDFEQRSAIEALGVKVESIEEQRAAALQSPDGIEFAVLLAVPKEAIISSLHDQVRPFESLAFPYDDETAQLLWALQYRQQILDALRLERAMAALGGGQPMLRMQLEQLQRDVQSVWQVAGVRVIADRTLTSLVGGLSAQLPSAANDRLWVRLTQKKQTANKGNQFFERREVVVHVSPASTPTKVLQQQTLRAVGKGNSASQAEQDAEQQILDLLDRPLSVWLFQ